MLFENARNQLIKTRYHQSQRAHEASRFPRQLDIPIAFQYAFGIARSIMQITMPTGSLYTKETPGNLDFYNAMEERNPFPATDEWLRDQIRFFGTLSDDDLLTLLTYGFRGDRMINDYLLSDGSPNPNLLQHRPEWYYHNYTGIKYALFEPQVRKCLGVDPFLDSADIAGMMTTLDTDQWKQIFDQYVLDMQRLFEQAPPITRPLVLYRGEKTDYTYGRLLDVAGKRFSSFTLDASVACFFSRGYSCPGCHSAPPGNVYRVFFPKGFKLILTAGLNYTPDLVEMECRAPLGIGMRQLEPAYYVYVSNHDKTATETVRVIDVAAEATPGMTQFSPPPTMARSRLRAGPAAPPRRARTQGRPKPTPVPVLRDNV